MQEAIQHTTFAEANDPLAAAAYRAETWAGEPFLRDGEDPAQALAAGTARRRALDEGRAVSRCRPRARVRVTSRKVATDSGASGVGSLRGYPPSGW